MAERTGILIDDLEEIVRIADLRRMIPMRRIAVLIDAGFDTLDKIAQAQPGELVRKVQKCFKASRPKSKFDAAYYARLPYWAESYPMLIKDLGEDNTAGQLRTLGPIPSLVPPDDGTTETFRRKGLTELRDFSRGAEHLIICDPYFYGGEAQSCSGYVREIVKASGMQRRQLRRIHILYSSRHGNTKTIKREFKQACSDNNIHLTQQDTDLIHDRFWIKDSKSAIIIGTSLGGIGRRLAFISRMSRNDLLQLLDFLKDKNLLS